MPRASAQEKPVTAPDYEAAKRHYQNAEQAAAKKDWNTAAKEYGIAYEITRDAVLFFKLGNAYQLSGDCTRAVEYFERYLDTKKTKLGHLLEFTPAENQHVSELEEV